MEKSHKRVALVTGANKGIGLEIARQLAREQITVLVGARDRQRGEAAAEQLRGEGLDARFIQLDVTDADSIAQAAATIGEHHGRLDILVNNAGIGDRADGAPDKADIEAVKRIFDTNFFGPLAVTQAMLPWLRMAPAARVVNMSSSLGSIAINGDRSSRYYGVRLAGYNASKAALNMLTVQLAEELRDTPIAVNAACPGYVSTDLNGHTGHLTPQQAAVTPVRLALLPDRKIHGQFVSAEGQVPW
ncbi:MAG TPA: SDR family oxidoreductase [Duganella sp.]|jgi:NAD(P)-dependent dehydrogenase (short-subunit alcohol dehydrogenase family)